MESERGWRRAGKRKGSKKEDKARLKGRNKRHKGTSDTSYDSCATEGSILLLHEEEEKDEVESIKGKIKRKRTRGKPKDCSVTSG